MRLNRLFKLVTSICLLAVMGLFLTSCFVTTNTSNSSNVKVLSFTKVNNAKMSNIKLNNNNITTGSNGISATADVYGVVSFDTKNLAEAYLSSSFKGTLAEFAETAAGKNVTSNINNYKNQLENKLKADNIKYTLKDTYTSVLSGVSVLVEYQYLDTIRNYKFVKNVALSNTYSAPKEVSYDELLASSSAIYNNDSNYDGTGIVVGVLDSALDYDHQAFQSETKEVLTKEIIEKTFSSLEASKTASDASELYISSKVPFQYDYADQDTDVRPGYMSLNYYDHGAHGTHVTGIIAGNDKKVKGVIPNAQVAFFKVFGDSVPGAKDVDIMAALCDAALLGVDVLNMSLGSTNGFTEGEEGREDIYEVYNLLARIGVTVCTAAGNEGEAGDASEDGMSSTSNPDNGLVGSPSTYPGNLSVAASYGDVSNYFETNGMNVEFTMGKSQTTQETLPFYEYLPFSGKKAVVEYVKVPGKGTQDTYEGIDVKGKFVVVERGDISFGEKAQIAASLGAAGIIIANYEESRIAALVDNVSIPVACINSKGAAVLGEKGTITFAKDYLYYQMASFSSLGPTPSLSLKPEISAPGVNVYSTLPLQYSETDTIGYGYMSGTSMATPNLAGLVSVVKADLKNKYPNYTNAEIAELTNEIVMSTAFVTTDESGTPITPRKQGAGIANLKAALAANAYLKVDGSTKAKLELGDDPTRSGVYKMTFNVVNTSANTLNYDLEAVVMTEQAKDGRTLEKGYLLSPSTVYEVSGGVLSGTTLTVAGASTAKVTVKVTLSENDKNYLDSTFANGMYVEGYVKLYAHEDVNLSIPFLSFYGGWNEAPVFDESYYSDEDFEIYPTYLMGLIYSGPFANPFILGAYNKYALPEGYEEPLINDEKIAFGYDINSELYAVNVSLLRSVKELYYEIVDKYSGTVYYTAYGYNIGKTYLNGDSIASQTHELRVNIPEYLVGNNQELTLRINAVLDDLYQTKSTQEISLCLDYEAPVLEEAKVEEVDGRTILKLKLYDNQFLACFGIGTSTADGDYESVSNYAYPIYDEERGGSSEVTFDITDFEEKLYNGTLAISVEDYAGNESLYVIDEYSQYLENKKDAETSKDGTVNNTKDSHTSSISAVSSSKVNGKKPNDDIIDVSKYENTGEEFVINNGVLCYYNGDGGTVVIPDGVTVIGNGVFSADKSITKLVIPEGVTIIGNNVCRFARKLTEIDFPSTLESIGDESITGCTDLKSLDFSKTKLSYIGFNSLCYCISAEDLILPALADVDGEKQYLTLSLTTLSYNLALKNVTVYSNVKNFREAFSGCPALEKVNFYGTVGKIGDNSLAGCSNLVELNFYGDCGTLGETQVEDWGSFQEVRDSNALSDFAKLKEVHFYGNVESLGGYTFSMCPKLEKVVFHGNLGSVGSLVSGDSMKLLSYTASEDNEYLENGEYGILYNKDHTKMFTPAGWDYDGEVVVPDTLESLPDAAFGTTLTAIRAVSLAVSIQKDDEGLVSGIQVTINASSGTSIMTKEKLQKLTIPAKYTEFPDAMMKGLVNADLVYDGEVTSVGIRAFNSTGITSFVGTSALKTVGVYAFTGSKKLTTVVLPDELELKGETGMFADEPGTYYMFNDCEKLTSVTLPSSWTTLGEGTFKDCTSLATIDLNKVTTLESHSNGTFENCSSLVDVKGLENVESVGDSVFKNCSSLVDANISLATTIGSEAFYGCEKLENVDVCESLESLGESAFAYCTNLKSMVIPEGVEGIDVATAFVGCVSLEKFVINNSDYKTVDGVVYSADGSEVVLFPAGLNKTEYFAPKGVVTIGTNAFYGAIYLTKVVANEVTEIGESAFRSSNILSFTGSNVKYIYHYAFADTSNLKNYDFTGVEEIGDFAFASSGLEKVVLTNSTSYLGVQVFNNCEKLTSLSVSKKTTKFDYADVFYGSNNVKEISIEKANRSFKLVDGILYNYDMTVLYAVINNNSKEIVIPEGVKKVATSAFYGNETIERVVFPESLKAIGAEAFYGCNSLKELEFKSEKAPILEGFYEENGLCYANFVHSINDGAIDVKLICGDDASYSSYIWKLYFSK